MGWAASFIEAETVKDMNLTKILAAGFLLFAVVASLTVSHRLIPT